MTKKDYTANETLLFVLIGFVLGIVLCWAFLSGYYSTKEAHIENPSIEEENCFDINSYTIYFDKEPILEFTLDDYNPMVSTQIIINETWHELILYPNNEEVCLDFTGEFKPVKIRNFNTKE